MPDLPRHIIGPAPRVPRQLAWAYTALVTAIVPVYWVWAGPQNFLWFCDIALLVTVVAIWRESALLASVAAVSVLAVELVWTADFLASVVTAGGYGGLTGYVFDPTIALGVRVLSVAFHLKLLILLPWLVWRLGYDTRALAVQTGVVWLVLPISRLASTAEQNVNWTYGLGRTEQTWMEPWAWVALLMVVVPIVVLLPTHLVLRRWWPSPAARQQ